MYSTLIVDDTPSHANSLAAMIAVSSYGAQLSCTCVHDLNAAARYLQEHSVDVLFMDICFETLSEGANGIAFVREQIPETYATQVIYVSGYIEYCTSVYQTDHVYFLTKPLDASALDDALRKALEKLNEHSKRYITLTAGGRVMSIDPDRIRYIESNLRKVRIHIDPRSSDGEHRNETSTLEIYDTLAHMKDMLPATFIQCHKSFLVNMACIEEIDAQVVCLRSGEQVPVSRKRRTAVKDAFLTFLNDHLGA